MLTVHLRVNDKANSRPTSVRLRLVDEQGQYHAPLGRLAHFPIGPGDDVGGHVQLHGQAHAYIDGTCEVRLPPGKIIASISKGPEYLPLQQEVTLAPGQISLRFGIERWMDWHRHGWYSGDLRATQISPHAALLEGAAEGLDVIQLLAHEQPSRLTNLLAFSGAKESLRSPDCLVAVNTLNEHPVLGKVSLLHCHRPVFPMRTGYDGEHWSIADWCDQCHRKSGLVVWADLDRWNEKQPQGEALAAMVLGKIDAYELSASNSDINAELDRYYLLLNACLRPALVGSSGKDSNARTLGAIRTLASLPPEQTFDADTWIEAVRARRTQVTAGPLLELTVSGQGPGSSLRSEPGQPVQVRVLAHSQSPVEKLELLAGGTRIACVQGSGVIETEFRPDESTWLAARCNSPFGWAHTSPVWIDVVGKPASVTRATIDPLLAILAQTDGWVQTHCDASDKQRTHIRDVIDQARRVLLARLSNGEKAGP